MTEPDEKYTIDNFNNQVNPNSFLAPNNTEKKGWLESLKSKFLKPKVAEEVLLIHEKKMVDLRFLAKMAYVIDNDKFCDKEFLAYIKIGYCLKKQIQGYEGMYQPTRLLQVAIKAKDSFLKIDQTEFRYRGSKQQEVYEFVGERLIAIEGMTDATGIFRSQVESKIEEMIPQIKTDEGKKALKVYLKELDRLADDELGLKLLSLFKAYQLDDYSILRKISDIAASLKKYDLFNLKGLAGLVATEFEIFEKIGKIIGLPQNKNTPATYALILQYIALEYRHGMVRIKFDELLQVMRKWNRPYQAILTIRNQFSAEEYKIPREFTEPIPGADIYEKYQKSLTDKRTGFTYISFED